MAILNDDVKLMESERLTDEDDGGGRMTGAEVTDGEVNNLFPDISRLDRVYGRVNLRKAFLWIDTANVDRYYGSHTIVDDAPDDPNVSVLLFSTGSHTDERASAQDRIESYVTQGPEAQVRLLGDQLAGQRSVTVYQRESERLPEIGQVFVLSIEDSGHADDGEQQYVRVSDVNAEVRTFTDTVNGSVVDFDARVVTLDITTELTRDFPGAAAQRDFSPGSTVVRSTQVANAAKYYGIATVEQAITSGDTQLELDTVYRPIVPATQGETPQVDIDAGATVTHEETSSGETVEVQDTAHTTHDEITLQTRGLAWTKTLRPLPAPGTAVVEFRALGRWYRIADRGDGKLEGDGTGSIDYGTGGLSVTLAALPDVGSAILYTWGTPTHYADQAGTGASIDAPVVEIVPTKDMEPGSVSITWNDGTARTATDDGVGNLTGDATGRVIYTGEPRIVRLKPNTVPDSTAQYQLDYQELTTQLESYTASNVVSGGTVSLTLATVPVKPGSVAITVPMFRQRNGTDDDGSTGDPEPYVKPVTVTDDGQGNLVRGGSIIGTVDYTTGDVSFDARQSYDLQVWVQVGGHTVSLISGTTSA